MVCFYSSCFCLGRDSLMLYAQIHQNRFNQLIHAIGMPFVGYAVFGGLPLLAQKFNPNLIVNNMRIAIYLLYVLYYWSFDLAGAMTTAIVYGYVLNKVLDDDELISDQTTNIFLAYYLFIFCFSLILQEFIGHSFFEEQNSFVCQIPNSIMIAPLFGIRAILHNFFGLEL